MFDHDGPVYMDPNHHQLIFVYGTLMRGEVSEHHLRGCEFVGADETAPQFTMVHFGWYPALLPDGETAIQGEVYRVDLNTLHALDEYEGHPHLYRRRAVSLKSGLMADLYLFQGRPKETQIIESGDWRHR